MAQVFISFVHEDQKVAEAVQHFLSTRLKLGKEVFLSSDQYMVFAGEDWLARIGRELRDARVVVLMMSARSVGRPWVNFEAGAAWLSNKPIIPVCYGQLMKDRLPKPYSGIQALNLGPERHYLLRSVAHHLGVPSPLITKTLEEIMNPKQKAPLESVEALGDMLYSLDTALEQFKDEC
jgi:hypothetical protein